MSGPPPSAGSSSTPDSGHATHAYERSSRGLDRAFALLGVSARTIPTSNGVIVPASVARVLTSRTSFVEGGARVPFIRALLHRQPGQDILMQGDTAHHLRRALEELHHAKVRANRIDRGQIPGALSPSEATRLLRRHPGLIARDHDGQ